VKLERNTLVNDYCWVCSKRFKSSVPPGPAMREDHHIFPRNAGGDDGPLVSLCDTHHSLIHKIANRLHTKKPFTDLTFGEQKRQVSKLLWLAAMIVKAEKSVEGDPNKLLRNGVMLNPQETKMMQQLQAVYKTKSRSDIFRAGLYLLYRKHFK
jgi:hypothetical protein